jgi:arylsulfatase A-like enzyme
MKSHLKLQTLGCLILVLAFIAGSAVAAEDKRPNIVLILTDDQGFGDLGCHGNLKIQTPHLDALARQSVEMKYFYVCPVCSPTRASLMTGRYNYRTGVVDTYLGRSLMHPDEVTLAQLLAAANYRTGIFGKWHLGDNYPMRPMDKGFQETLVLKGGGIGQPSDLPGGSSYFDPVLLHNGKPEKTKGYCSDVFTDAAIRFLEQNRDRPCFVYLPFNAPHAPLQVPDSYYQKYKDLDLGSAEFPAIGYPITGRVDPAETARVYGMVTNIDDNVGRLLAKLDQLHLAEQTLVIFLTDNGPQQPRYNSGLRGRKGSVYDGGSRVPCFVRFPDRFKPGRKIDRIAAHIDLAPTIVDVCGIPPAGKPRFDGRSLLPLLQGEPGPWPDRTLFFQWHRGDEPEMFRAFAARSQRWKLVQALGSGPGRFPAQPKYELFDMAADPFERNDLAGRHPEIVDRLRKDYQTWFRDVSGTRGFAPPRIYLGTPHENPTLLTRQDWRGPQAGWTPKALGYWEVYVAQAGSYEITVHFAASGSGSAHVTLGKLSLHKSIATGAVACSFGPVRLEAGSARLEPWVAFGNEKVGVQYVEVAKKDE